MQRFAAMKTLSQRIRTYGIRKLARELGTQPSTVKRWADANEAPSWRLDQLRFAFKVKHIVNGQMKGKRA